MTKPQSRQALESAFESLRARIEVVGATFVDGDIQERLAPLRSHLSTAAMMLLEPTPANLRRIAERLDYATKQFALLTKAPEAAKRGPYER